MTDYEKLEKAIATAESRIEYETRAAAAYAPGCNPDEYRALVAAARAHLATLPKPPSPKFIDAWHVHAATTAYGGDWKPVVFVCANEAEARELAAERLDHMGDKFVAITGPHKHMVPA